MVDIFAWHYSTMTINWFSKLLPMNFFLLNRQINILIWYRSNMAACGSLKDLIDRCSYIKSLMRHVSMSLRAITKYQTHFSVDLTTVDSALQLQRHVPVEHIQYQATINHLWNRSASTWVHVSTANTVQLLLSFLPLVQSVVIATNCQGPWLRWSNYSCTLPL